MIHFKIWRDARDITDPKEYATTGYDRPSMRKCWEFLDRASRSFAMVIKELEGDLARTVCIFYLVLRACDTLEDDMTLPNSVKLPMLRSLYLKLHEPGWNFDGSGPNEADRMTLAEFDVIQKEFSMLDERYQLVIEDICMKMGRGMADFAALATPEKPVAEINTMADYDLYCHYVAGLVGEGLSGIFAASGKERAFIANQLTLSNSMGMILQKTNILRDVKEDVEEGRGFWPRAIWGKYGFDSMKELLDPTREKQALFAASEMTLDALRHATDSLDYLTLIKNQSVFNFVAIPPVMAIATLERCYMNPNVLKKNVKIRRGETIQLILRATNPRDVALIFRSYARKIHQKTARDDPNLLKMSIACGKIEQWTEHHYPSFLQIRMQNGAITTVIDDNSSDGRVPLFHRISKQIKDKQDEEKREQWVAQMVDKGIIKSKEEYLEREEQRKRVREIEDAQPFPWLIVVGAIVGFIALIVAISGVVYYLVAVTFKDA
ncbi:farnesyl-diphosphate farnesyltransferase [Tremella mesenterica]|uniref:Squalene synthase n=1 Tax=Tremella mesenterica TaxID=5217 RepID=A0A4Q1BB21_TREME|nr:farnesyl-diphosphate farnesyltransferase [Tremella mesenterica]